MPILSMMLGGWLGALKSSGQTAANLENRFICVALSSNSLAKLRDMATGQDFSEPGRNLWELQLRAAADTTRLEPSAAGTVRVEEFAAPTPGRRWRIAWGKFPAPLPQDLAVEVEVTLADQEPMSQWRIAVRGLGQHVLTQVRFPVLYNRNPQKREELAVPVWMGQAVSAPRNVFRESDGKARRSEWHYPGELSLQCLALWGEKAGLYLACNDTAAFRKAFSVFGAGPNALGFEVVHWPELDARAAAEWALPYEVVLGTFKGDWFSAAERYRSWATNQQWAVHSRVRRGAVPDWAANRALWVWNRGRSQQVLAPALELQRRLGLPVGVFWHWWHGCAYDDGFPDYLPPREGAEHFSQAVADAQARGVNALIYMNQRLWGMKTQSWTNEQAANWAVKRADGKVHPEVYNTFTRAPCAAMCLGTPFWRDKYAGIAEEAVAGLGVAGIYMDQACLSLSCYDATHGHTVGGGTYWIEGFKRLASDIRGRCANQQRHGHNARMPALAGEGCGEPWLTQLDLMLSLQVSKERYSTPDGWETIPFFHAVYHSCSILFGNYSSLTMPPYDELWPPAQAPAEPLKLLDRKFATQFCLEQARAFVWGQQPTIANFTVNQLTSRAEEIEYVLRLARLRHRHTKYLLSGALLRPPRLEVAKATIPMSRLSIYAGQQGGLTSFEKEVPLALGSAWRAPDGDVAIILASIADAPLDVSLSFQGSDYGLRVGSRVIRRDMERSGQIGIVTGPSTTLRLELPARGAAIVEFAKP